MIFIIFSLFKIIENQEKMLRINVNIDKGFDERTIIAIPQEGGYRYDVYNKDGRIKNSIIKIKGPYNFRNRRVIIISVDTLEAKDYKEFDILFYFDKKPFISKFSDDKFFERFVLNGSSGKYYKLSEKKNREFNEGIRIDVDSEGIYRVSYKLLSRNNIDFSPEIHRIRLEYKGKIIPVDVFDLDNDNVFDNNDYFIFYAECFSSEFDTLNHYWLKEGDGEYYNHIETDFHNDTINSFNDSIVFDNNSVYTRSAGEWFYAQDTLFIFSIDNSLWNSDTSYFKFRVFNNSYYSQNLYFYADDSLVSQYEISGLSSKDFSGNIFSKYEKIKIKTSSFIYLKYLKVYYKKNFVSDGYKIGFNVENKSFIVNIKNFLSERINVYRINGYKIENPSIFKENGIYSVSFSDTNSQLSSYYVYTSGSEFLPKSIRKFVMDKFLQYRGSDVILITSPEFFDYALNYKNYYENKESLSVEIFTTDEIYNAFNYGEKSPYAIKEFLKYCMELENPPSYLVLFGKGTYDTKNVLKNNTDIVPVIMKNVIGGFYASDFEFSKVCGEDDFPDIIVGRIPVLTGTEFNGYIDKIIYGSSSEEPKENRVFFGADYALQGADSVSDGIIRSILPSGYIINKVYSREGTSVWEEVIRFLSSGQTIFNFHGHGGEEDLGAGRYFRIYDIPRLTNYGKLTFMLAFSCANGIMDDPLMRSVSEYSVIFPGVGMIGSIAPSGLTYFGENVVTDKFLLNSIFRKDIKKLGDILFSYKFLYPEHYNSTVYHLIGDPLYELKLSKDTLKFIAEYNNETLHIECLNQIRGRFFFTVLDSLKKYEFNFNVDENKNDTFIYLPISSDTSKVIALLKNDEYLISGEEFIEKMGIFKEINLYPETLKYNDTINIISKLNIIPDSVLCFYGYDGSINNRFFMSESSGYHICRIPIIKDGVNFHFRIFVYDSTKIYRSRIFSKYILKRPDLQFTSSDVIVKKKNIFLKINVLNKGEEIVDSTKVSIYKFITNDYYNIYDTIIKDIIPAKIVEISIPFDSFIEDTLKEIKFKIFIDSDNWLEETSENNNIFYLNKIRDFYKVSVSDTNIIEDDNYKIIFLPQTFKDDIYVTIKEKDYEKPSKQDDFKPGTFGGIEKSFNISFQDTIFNPFFIKLKPDSSSGGIYLRRGEKWINLGSDSFWLIDTGDFTYGFNNDFSPPLLKIRDDTIFSNSNNVRMRITMEDENGIDIWIKKPKIGIDGEIREFNVIETKDLNLINLDFEGSFTDGIHNLKIFVDDVHGNEKVKDVFINIQTPFLITYFSNFPNPAKTYTKFVVEFTKDPDLAELEVYQPSGILVFKKKIMDLKEGRNIIEWDIKDLNGKPVPNGVYLYVLKARKGILEIKEKGKMAVLKR